MKILVCISKVPDTTAKIAFTDNNTQFDTNGVQFIINPYDEWYALVRGLEIKEAQGGSVTVINVGGADNDPTIRKALAIGADDAVRIDGEPKDALYTAKQIAHYAKENDFDMVLCGKETIDYNGSQVAGMVAAFMDQPYVSNASKMEMDGNKAKVTRDIQGGKEILEMETPFVISAAKGMAARTKPLNVVEAVDFEDATSVVSYQLPPEKGDCKMVDVENPKELLELLRNEAKII